MCETRFRNAKAPEQDREQDECERCRAHQPADHDNGQRLLDFRTGPRSEQQRHQSEGGDAGGHHHRTQPAYRAFEDNVGNRHAICEKFVEVADQDQAVEHSDPEQGDEADGGRDREVFTEQPQGEHPTHKGKRHVGKDQQRLPDRAERRKQNAKDQDQRDGNHDGQARGRPTLVLELATPDQTIALGKLNFSATACCASSTNPTRSRPVT